MRMEHLCRSCMESNVNCPLLDKVCQCHHSHANHALVGTWCTPDLEKAVAMGYTILTIHEVWHFAATRVGLFEDYVNTWLKI